MLAQPSELFEQLIGAGWDESRGDDRIGVAVFIGCFCDESLGAAAGILGAFRQTVGRIAVHVDLADIGYDPAFLELVHEQLGGFSVDRAEYDGTGGRAAVKRVGKDRIGFVGIIEICVLCFLFKRVVLEPVEQLHIRPEPAIGILRRVDMQIDHTGHDQLARVVVQGQILCIVRQLAVNQFADPAAHDDICVLDRDHPFIRGAKDNVALQHKAVHTLTSSIKTAVGDSLLIIQ